MTPLQTSSWNGSATCVPRRGGFTGRCWIFSRRAWTARRTRRRRRNSSLALRHNGEGVDVYFNSSCGTSRRFAACCLPEQWLEKGANTERLIPATDGKTADQQFQYAFAQEFLCPFDALKDRLRHDLPTNDDIDDAAAHFGASPLVVRTTLVNKGELERECLVWASRARPPKPPSNPAWRKSCFPRKHGSSATTGFPRTWTVRIEDSDPRRSYTYRSGGRLAGVFRESSETRIARGDRRRYAF